MNDELTVAEINTLIEAVDAWTSSSKRDSLMAGLFMGALICNGDPSRAEEGKAVAKKFTEGEDEKQKSREDQAILLKAKLIAMRDKAEAREFAKSLAA